MEQTQTLNTYTPCQAQPLTQNRVKRRVSKGTGRKLSGAVLYNLLAGRSSRPRKMAGSYEEHVWEASNILSWPKEISAFMSERVKGAI